MKNADYLWFDGFFMVKFYRINEDIVIVDLDEQGPLVRRHWQSIQCFLEKLGIRHFIIIIPLVPFSF